MYQYTEFDKAFVRARAAEHRDQLERWQAGQLSDEQFRPLRLQNGWYVQRYAPMLRVAVPYGELNSAQLRVLAQIARDYDTPKPEVLATAQNTQDKISGTAAVPIDAPKLVTNEMVKNMKPGSVLVDIAIDQGGCFEDSHPTTHAEPTFKVHNSVFYCVANMPGAVPHTSTYALTNATLPYVRALANHGWLAACRADASLALGLNVHAGQVTNAGVAQAHSLAEQPLAAALS